MSAPRILGRIEKALLALGGGFVFMGLATIVAPGLQSLVAGVACPAGATASAVVRYPRIVEPPEMVRNTPLVCVVDGQAQLASHARVLPALFVVGLLTSIAVIVAVSAVVRVARAGRRDTDVPQRRRRAMERVRVLPLLIAMPFVFMAAYGFYWWLAVDTPYRVTGCSTSSGAGATCYDGEPVYRNLSLGFGALAVFGVAFWVVAVGRGLGRDRRFAQVWATGLRATATLIAAKSTNTKVNGATVQRFTYEIRPPDGSAPFTFEEQGTWHDAGTVGSVVEAMYDPGDRDVVFVLPPGTAHRSPSPISG